VLVVVGAHVGHRVFDDDDVETAIVGLARGGFDAGGGGDSGEEDLGCAGAAQDAFEGRSVERADLKFRDRVVAWLAIEFGNEFGPIGGRTEVKRGVDAAGCAAFDVYEDDGKVAFAESTCEFCGALGDVGGGVRAALKADDTFL
jgi:hypothetical protein